MVHIFRKCRSLPFAILKSNTFMTKGDRHEKTLVVLLLSASPAAAVDLDERRAQCVGWMMSGYPSGLEETSCTAQFSLPSPFLFKCVRAERLGFERDTQKCACQHFFIQASVRANNGYVRED